MLSDKYYPFFISFINFCYRFLNILIHHFRTIVISDHKLLKELFTNTNSTGRVQNAILTLFGKNRGVVNSQGPVWEEQRRFTVRKLRDMGLHRSSIENIMLEELKSLLNLFERYAHKKEVLPDEKMMFTGAVVNSLWSLVAGDRSEWDGPVEPEILKLATQFFIALGRIARSGLFFAPGLRYIAPKLMGWTGYVRASEEFQQIVHAKVNSHLKNHDANNLV